MNTFFFKSLMLTVLLFTCLTITNCQSTASDGLSLDISKIKNQEIVRVFENAKVYNKPVILIFDAKWCPYCKQLNEETLQNDEVLKTLEKFERMNIDIDENEDDATTFNGKPRSRGGNGIPAIIIFSAEGKELERMVGFHEAKDFNRILKQTLKKIK